MSKELSEEQKEIHKIRNSKEYKVWREAVFTIDDKRRIFQTNSS